MDQHPAQSEARGQSKHWFTKPLNECVFCTNVEGRPRWAHPPAQSAHRTIMTTFSSSPECFAFKYRLRLFCFALFKKYKSLMETVFSTRETQKSNCIFYKEHKYFLVMNQGFSSDSQEFQALTFLFPWSMKSHRGCCTHSFHV